MADPTSDPGDGRTDDTPIDDDAALNDAVAEYIDRIILGEQISAAEVISQYPQFAARILLEIETFRGIPVNSQPLSERTMIGEYELRRVVGQGGMGIVYEAWQPSEKRRVALKILPFSLSDDQVAFKRFLREAEVAASLKHDNIVPVYDVGRHEDRPYFAMELVDGVTLAQVISHVREVRDPSQVSTKLECDSAPPKDSKPSQNLSEDDDLPSAKLVAAIDLLRVDSVTEQRCVAELFAGVASGLDTAHSMNVIHRDVKPSNLVIDASRAIRLLDFGLARLEGVTSLTMSGDIVGTPSYMSPEQASPREMPIDHRTDIYSLGATLYELLTLERPCRGETQRQTLLNVIHKAPTPARRTNPAIHVDLETIIHRCLEKHPEDRYQTGAELAQDLTRFSRGRRIVAQRPALWDRGARLMVRHRRIVLISALLAALVIIGLSLSFALTFSALQRAERILVHSVGRSASQKINNRDFAEAALDLQRWPSAFHDSFAYDHLRLRCDLSLGDVLSHEDGITDIAFLDDGRLVSSSRDGTIRITDLQSKRTIVHALDGGIYPMRIACTATEVVAATSDSGVLVWDFTDDSVRRVSPARDKMDPQTGIPANARSIAISPDSESVAVSGPDNVWIWNLKDLSQLEVRPVEFGLVDFVLYGPDGTLYASHYKGKVYRWDPHNRQPKAPIQLQDRPLSLAISRDGRLLAAGTRNQKDALFGTVEIVDLRTNERSRVIINRRSVRCVTFMAGDRQILAANEDGTISVIDVRAVRQVAILPGHQAGVSSIRIKGERFYSASVDGMVKEWDLLTTAGVSTLCSHDGFVTCVDISSDDTLFAAGDQNSQVIVRDMTGTTVKVYEGHSDDVWAVAFDPTNRFVASGDKKRTIHIWPVSGSGSVTTIRGFKGSIRSIEWSADGFLAAGSEDGFVRVYDMRGPKPELKWQKPHGNLKDYARKTVLQTVFLPQRPILASSADDPTVKLWDVRTGELIQTLDGLPEHGRALAVRQDGQQIACGCSNGSIYVWALSNSRADAPPQILRGHVYNVRAIAYLADGTRLVSASEDRTVVIWDMKALKRIAVLEEHTSRVSALAITRDENCIISAGDDNTVRMWFRTLEGARRTWTPQRYQNLVAEAIAARIIEEEPTEEARLQRIRACDDLTAAEKPLIQAFMERGHSCLGIEATVPGVKNDQAQRR